MKYYNVLMILCSCMTSIESVNAQAKTSGPKPEPFIIVINGQAVTGNYLRGQMYYSNVTNTGSSGTYPSQQMECRPGSSICFFDVVVHNKFTGVVTNASGQKSLDIKGVENLKGSYPVVISRSGNDLQFAVDLSYLPAEQRSAYQSSTWKVENPFALSPQTVRELGLYSGTESMSYIIPAGNYPLYRDGNITYWKFGIPQ